MRLPKIKVQMKFDKLRCLEPNEGGGDEPYLFTFFFKIDGETFRLPQGSTPVGAQFQLHYDAHDNLPAFEGAGDEHAVPAHIGEYNTVLTPISIQLAEKWVLQVGGFVGMFAILMEEDQTKDGTMETAHQWLNFTIPSALNDVLRSLDLKTIIDETLALVIEVRKPLEECAMTVVSRMIEAMMGPAIQRIKQDLTTVVLASELQGFNIFGLVSRDDLVGTGLKYFSPRPTSPSGFIQPLLHRFEQDGRYEMSGQLGAQPLYTPIPLNVLPLNMVEFEVKHYTKKASSSFLPFPKSLVASTYALVGGTTDAGHWKATDTLVASLVRKGLARFYIKSPDGSKNYLLAKLAPGTSVLQGKYMLSSTPDETPDNNLTNLPPCKQYVEEP